MIPDLKPYPTMKDSGVEWLGEIPAHWEAPRLRNIVHLLVSNVDKHTIEGEIPVRLCNYVDVYKNDRITDQIAFMRASASQAEVERFRLRRGDVVITKDSESWNDIGVPVLVEYEAPDLVCGYHLAILRPHNQVLTGGYLFRALQSQGVAVQYHISANGVTRYGLSHDAIKSVILPIPPPAEQAAIVRFLDYVDRRIRRYIRAKQKLIALLEEQKQAIIHRAVTRGLDPNVRLKPSGVEWLGEVPEHWEVSKIKHLARPEYKAFVDGDWIESPFITSDGIRLIQTGNIGAGTYREKGFRYISVETFREFGCTEFQPGDVLICRLGKPVARACLAPQLGKRMITSVDVCILKPRDDVNAQFVVYAMSSRRYLDWVGSLVRGSTRDRVSRSMMGSFSIPLPPLPEQAVIVRFLDEATADLNHATAAAQRQIELLGEYRTRLIADVVTGKLNVRQTAANLPEEAEEPEDWGADEAEEESDQGMDEAEDEGET